MCLCHQAAELLIGVGVYGYVRVMVRVRWGGWGANGRGGNVPHPMNDMYVGGDVERRKLVMFAHDEPASPLVAW